MEVTKVFKESEAGLIPQEWLAAPLGKLANISRGASPRPIESPIWFDEKSPVGWVRISDVTKSKRLLKETTQKLSKLGIQYSRLYLEIA